MRTSCLSARSPAAMMSPSRVVGASPLPQRAPSTGPDHAAGRATPAPADPSGSPRQNPQGPIVTTATPVPTTPANPPHIRRIAWASMVGTSLESFDFYVFAYFSAFFVGPLFFDPLGGFGGTLAAFSTIAIAFVVRPIGAAIFGHMGDRLG